MRVEVSVEKKPDSHTAPKIGSAPALGTIDTAALASKVLSSQLSICG